MTSCSSIRQPVYRRTVKTDYLVCASGALPKRKTKDGSNKTINEKSVKNANQPRSTQRITLTKQKEFFVCGSRSCNSHK